MAIEMTVRPAVNESDETKKQMRDFGAARAATLEEAYPDIEWVRAVIDKDGALFSVVVEVHGARQMSAQAEHKDIDVYTAIGSAFDKADVQLRKQSEKNIERH